MLMSSEAWITLAVGIAGYLQLWLTMNRDRTKAEIKIAVCEQQIQDLKERPNSSVLEEKLNNVISTIAELKESVRGIDLKIDAHVSAHNNEVNDGNSTKR